MRHRTSELNMPHSLPTDRRPCDGHAAAVTRNALKFNPLILAAISFPIPDGAEYLLAEKAVLFRFQSPVIKRLRFFHDTGRPGTNHIGRRDLNGNSVLILYSFALFDHMTFFLSFDLSGVLLWPCSSPARTILMSRHKP